MSSLNLVEPSTGNVSGSGPGRPEPLTAATWPRDNRAAQRLLVIDTRDGSLSDRGLRDLPELLEPGDLVVVNDAATLPASLEAMTEAGESIELRLVREHRGLFWALALGAGNWRVRTEDRGPPPKLVAGMRLTFTAKEGGSEVTPGMLAARVVSSESIAPATQSRVICIAFEQTGARFWDGLYRVGRPIQYSYVERPLELWHVQNVFAARPWAFELPSAAHGFDWSLIRDLRRHRIELATLTHSAGISSTGSEELDRLLPFPERYDIPRATVDSIERTRQGHRRVVAVGTTVVRALESAAHGGHLVSGPGEARLVLSPFPSTQRTTSRPRVVDSVLSGIHQPGESHHALLEVFAPAWLLAQAGERARAHGYLTHEFGDACLVIGT